MASLVSALNTEFTPAAGDFIAQATGGAAILQRKDSSGVAFADVGLVDQAVIVSNPVAGAVFKFITALTYGTPTVQADQ